MTMPRPSNRCILEALALADKMIALAERGETESQDDSCRVLYGLIRDFGYAMRRQAEQERMRHLAAGTWDESAAACRGR